MKKNTRSQTSPKGPPPPSAQNDDFPIVGIGASAGGLEAFQVLLKNLSPDTGMAFVIVQHLDPMHESHLAEILSRNTSMPVLDLENGMVPKRNHVYVIPAPSTVIYSSGTFGLESRAGAPVRPVVIDAFLSSIGKEKKERAIGVILSGTGSDGAHGMVEIKEQGGVTFAQDNSAQHDGMPQAAIATGCVDFILSPEQIAVELARLSGHPQMRSDGSPKTESSGSKGCEQKILPAILRQLHRSLGVDFTFYKQNTIQRRIARRMMLLRIETLKDYLDYLCSHPPEAALLHQDLLIKVTRFFRDPQTFEALKSKVFPLIMKDRGDAPIRIWVPACATGEEVYSIAICLLEYLERTETKLPIHIFGTDLSEVCVDGARAGLYHDSALGEVSEERLKRFFTKDDGGYRINKTVRELCVFSKHNATVDPPFSNLDLVSCRNFLIYLDSTLQRRVVSLFHYGLTQNGLLLLGSSESLGAYGDIFSPVDLKHRIFSKKTAPRHSHFDFAKGHTTSGHEARPVTVSGEHKPSLAFDLTQEVDRAIAARLGPDGVVINDDMQIVLIRGHTGDFLEPAPGEASHNILKMARSGLLTDLRMAILRAKREKRPIRKEEIRVKVKGNSRLAFLDVIPLRASETHENLYVVLFSEEKGVGSGRRKTTKPSTREAEVSSTLSEVEQELTSTREYLQALIEKEQAYGEEMKSANEEILSSNEELQSTNEELETAKEELQSINEELNTLNDELQNGNRELNVAVNDLNNLLLSVRIPVLMLSRDLRIRRITPGAERIVNVIPGDVGRPLTDIRSDLNFAGMVPLLREVIENVSPQMREVQDSAGRWFALWARPYLTHDNKIDGVVVTLFDIDALTRARDFSDAIVQTVREPLLVLDSHFEVRVTNSSFCEMFHTSVRETVGKSIFHLGDGEWDIPALRELLDRALRSETVLQNLRVSHEFPGLGPKTFVLNARKVTRPSNEPQLVLIAFEDITGAEQELRDRANHLIKVNMELEQFTYIAAHDLQEPLRNVANYLQLLARQSSGQLDEESQNLIREAIGSARTMKTLVEDLLAFSRTGKEDLRFEATDCEAVVKAVLEHLKSSIEESGAQITFDPLPTIAGNPGLLGQIFQNLIGNAIKFRKGEPPRIHVGAIQKGDEWEFSVRDSGIGIPKEYHKHIFSVFERLHSSEAYPGTGIGLAICKKIVERYGGVIWVESHMGEGANFFFTIPLKRGDKDGKSRG
ncbi:MAG: PAS domain-containing protein [Deltaproteobacteria bacterium]|nr:PAS domain-containing protein [Deltaproteobacteria bacterium]